jgi:MATE family multidrug resistance protein
MAIQLPRSSPSLSPTPPGHLREVAALALPLVLSQLSRTAMGVIDSAMVGRLGPTELAAVGYGGIWMWTALCAFLGTATGVQTFVSQAHGAGRTQEAAGWTWQALYSVAPVAGLGLAGFGLAAPTFFRVLGPSPELQGLTAAYVGMRSLGAGGLAAAMVMASYFRGLGDTRTPLAAIVAANLVNVVLDYGLIFGRLGLPEWGVAGAGAATAIAEWLYAVFLALAFRRRLRTGGVTRVPRPDLGAVRRFARTAVPIGGQWVLEMLSFAFFSTLVARMGVTAMAATQALLMLLSLSFMQAVGISIAATTLVGRYVGAGNLDAVERSHRSAVKLGLGLGVTIALLFLAIPEALLRIFTDDADVLALARPLLALGAAFQLLDALGIVSGGSLRGAGDTRWPFVVETAFAWLFFLPLAWLLGIGLEGGLLGAWIAGSLWVGLISLVLLRRFGSGAWRTIRI